MVHKECKLKNLVESYRPLILTSCIGKRLEKGSHRQPEQLGRNLRKKSDRQQNSFKKKRSTMITYSNYLKQLRYGFHKASFYHRNPSLCREGLWFDGLLFKLKNMGPNRKLIRSISNFFSLLTFLQFGHRLQVFAVSTLGYKNT